MLRSSRCRCKAGKQYGSHGEAKSKTRRPGTDKEVNWLPAPKGPFNLTTRLYSPKSDALTGKWNPPPITKIQGTSSLMAQ